MTKEELSEAGEAAANARWDREKMATTVAGARGVVNGKAFTRS
jgi:hypothetical protein